MGCVAGYTIVNDISDRAFKPNPNRKPRERDKFFDWMHGKWHDTFCPMGPCILSADVGSRPAGDPDQAHGQRRGEAGRIDGRDGLPGGGDRLVHLANSSRSSRAT